jgi:hypothetical protein
MAGPMLSEVVRHLRRLAGLHPASAKTDNQLLERFVNQHSRRDHAGARQGRPMAIGVV